MARADQWRLAYLLPNIELPRAAKSSSSPSVAVDLGTDAMCLARGDDDRVEEIRARSESAALLLDSFVDLHGNRYRPTVLLVRERLNRAAKHSRAAAVGFRNAVALSAVLRARAQVAKGYGGLTAYWSDYFDFHPARLNPLGRPIIDSPAVVGGIAQSAPLTFSRSPHISHFSPSRLTLDLQFAGALGRLWESRWIGVPKRVGIYERVFRSLEIAYQACAVGAKNEASIHDYGVQIGLWVSAVEILVWQPPEVRQRHALDFLLAARLPPALKRARYLEQVKWKGPRERLNAYQFLLALMYRARNAFLHGNPVKEAQLMTRVGRAAHLPLVSPLVYRAVLHRFVEMHLADQASDEDDDTFDWKSYMGVAFNNFAYDEAMEMLFLGRSD